MRLTTIQQYKVLHVIRDRQVKGLKYTSAYDICKNLESIGVEISIKATNRSISDMSKSGYIVIHKFKNDNGKTVHHAELTEKGKDVFISTKCDLQILFGW